MRNEKLIQIKMVETQIIGIGKRAGEGEEGNVKDAEIKSEKQKTGMFEFTDLEIKSAVDMASLD